MLDDTVSRLAGARNAADAAIVDFVADRVEADDWHGHGIKSIEHFCTWQFGLTHSRASGTTAMAKRRNELIETFDKFRSGALSFEQVALIARHCPTNYEHSVSEFAVVATIPQLSLSLRQYSWPRPDPPVPGQEWKKRASFATNDNGDFRLLVTGDAEEGSRVEAALGQYWNKVKDARAVGDDEAVTNHEAFMALIDSAADADLSTSRRNRHRTLLHLEATDLVDWSNGLAPRLHLGPLVDEETMRLLTCDGAVQLVLTDFGAPVRLGRASRAVPSWLRDLVVGRDDGCRFCGSRVGLDVHHIIHWADGGPTDPSNLVTLCSRHHTLLHKGEFTISGNPERLPGSSLDDEQADGLTFHHRSGHPLQPPLSRQTDDPPRGTYKHPLGERLNHRDVWFSPTS